METRERKSEKIESLERQIKHSVRISYLSSAALVVVFVIILRLIMS